MDKKSNPIESNRIQSIESFRDWRRCDDYLHQYYDRKLLLFKKVYGIQNNDLATA